MNLFGLSSRDVKVDSVNAGCRIGEGYIQCQVGKVSDKVLTCTFPASRFKDSLLDLLNKSIAISIDNQLIEGTLSWYTIEESSYRVGITISAKDRSAWRRIIECRGRGIIHTSANPA